MTVDQLIEELKGFAPDALVKIESKEGGGYLRAVDIEWDFLSEQTVVVLTDFEETA